MRTVELRERGVYKLPDGREFVVSAAGDGVGYLLYNWEEWRWYGLSSYRAQANGRILCRGFVTDWRVEDLKDTGRTAEDTKPTHQAA